MHNSPGVRQFTDFVHQLGITTGGRRHRRCRRVSMVVVANGPSPLLSATSSISVTSFRPFSMPIFDSARPLSDECDLLLLPHSQLCFWDSPFLLRFLHFWPFFFLLKLHHRGSHILSLCWCMLGVFSHYMNNFQPNSFTLATLKSTVDFYHLIPLLLTLILAGGHKVSNTKQNLFT